MKGLIIGTMAPKAWTSAAGRKGFTQTILCRLEDGQTMTGSVFGMTEALENEEISEVFKKAKTGDVLFGQVNIIEGGKKVFNVSYNAGIGFVWDEELKGEALEAALTAFVGQVVDTVPAKQGGGSRIITGRR